MVILVLGTLIAFRYITLNFLNGGIVSPLLNVSNGSNVKFSISPSTVSLKSGGFSQVVTIQVTKSGGGIPGPYVVKLEPDTNSIWPVSAYTNQTEYNYTTKPLATPGASDLYQFEVRGVLTAGTSATYNITAYLLYNGTVQGQPKVLTVQMTR
ncbi:MAG: hypothetical protein QXF01_02225 [Candidatus Micrarchaeaceae archaeon]